MALSDSTVWECRASGASDNNGGGFVTGASGTDYSQQNSAQYALTSLASAGSGDTVLSAAAATDMVGNIAQVISGTNFTVGFFQITSVSAGVSITFSTNNAGAHICTGVGASGVINIGGALATLAKLNGAINWNQKAYCTGTFTLTSAITLASIVDASHGSRPIRLIGYSSARGDNGRTVWTTATNGVAILEFTQASGYTFENIEFSSTAGTPGHGLEAKTTGNSGGILLVNCLIHGFNIGIRGDWNANWAFGSLVLFKSKIYSCTSHGINNYGNTLVLASYITGNGGDGLMRGNNTGAPNGIFLVWRSVIKSNTGKGINDGSQEASNNKLSYPVVIESDVLDNTGDGIVLGNTARQGLILLNDIIDGNGGYGANAGAGNTFFLQLLASIAWRSNSSGDVQSVTKSATDVTLTGDPFTDRSSADFTLNGTSGAGAACKGIGEPLTFPPS